MKKILFIIGILPVALVAQNITNTLGVGGTFVVEDNGNNVLISANRTTTNDFIVIGDYANTYNLPPYSASNLGTVIFPQNNASSRLDFISSGFGHKSFLNFLYTPGSLTSPLDLQDGNVIGLIEFGGYFNGSWRSNAAKMEVVVSGTPSGIANIPTEMQFTNNAAGTPKKMTFDNGGNLIVPSAITSQAIKPEGVNYAATASDQTIICTTNIIVTLPSVADVPVGKTYTVKKGYAANNATTINTTGGQFIDGGTATSASLTGNNVFGFITIQSDGTRWWIIAQGNGI